MDSNIETGLRNYFGRHPDAWPHEAVTALRGRGVWVLPDEADEVCEAVRGERLVRDHLGRHGLNDTFGAVSFASEHGVLVTPDEAVRVGDLMACERIEAEHGRHLYYLSADRVVRIAPHTMN